MDLQGELETLFLHPDRALPDREFNRLALEVFRRQYEGSHVLAAFWRGRGVTPGSLERWEEIPPVPASAFKYLDLYSGSGEPEAVFLTSGTRGGGERRGRHPVASLALYRRASMPWFGMNLVPEGGRLPILALVPEPADPPRSSLGCMMAFALKAHGGPGSGFFADEDRGVDVPGLQRSLEALADAGAPVLVMGTAFAWVQFLDESAARGWRISLPGGSRLMETGGFKGRSRVVPRVDLYAALETTLGVPEARMVNEYGMTELLSQLYEPALAELDAQQPSPGLDARVHVPPPWLRVRALDPETLVPRRSGDTGILAFFDLANVGSVSAILTEDLGSVDEEGVRLEGRTPDAEPRGCSLAMEELLGGGR